MSSEDDSKKKGDRIGLSPADRIQLIRDYNIRFYLDSKQDRWPRAHYDFFSKIKDLGSYRYQDYRIDVYEDAKRPWRKETKQRAETIVLLAQKCFNKRSNEQEWRIELENYVFHRFRFEVNCRDCTGKLWKSDIEAKPYSKDLFSSGLADRQKKRAACKCSRQGPNTSALPLNNLFSGTKDSSLIYEEGLLKRLRKKFEKPDAVYGLNKTGRIKRLLFTKDKRPESGGQEIGKIITASPFDKASTTTFPFLLTESKSGKSGKSQSDIWSQMAFEIRALLLIQHNLHRAVGKDSKWASGPLVWCVSQRGAEWNVTAAFIKGKNEPRIRIQHLWTGDISNYDGSLRLVLILDHIFDWARDVYREAIISELQSLAVPTLGNFINDASSSIITETVKSYLGTKFKHLLTVNHHKHEGFSSGEEIDENNSDTETESGQESQELPSGSHGDGDQANFAFNVKLNRIASWNQETIGHIDEFLQVRETQDPLQRFDSGGGALRDAKFIRSRVIGLYITEQNLEALFNSEPTDQASGLLLRKIITRFEQERPLFVNHEALTALESAWTGVDRASLEFLNLDEEFQILMTFSAYLTINWEQTRELCYIAISNRAKDLLYQYISKNEAPKGYLRPKCRKPCLVQDVDTVMKIVSYHLQAPIQANLSACLYRISLCPSLKVKSHYNDSENDIFENHRGQISCEMKPYSTRKSRDLVWSIYNRNRVGRNEPSTPFLRLSSRLDQQTLNEKIEKPLLTPWMTVRINPADMAILAQSEVLTRPAKNSVFSSPRCIFLFDRSQLASLLSILYSGKQLFKYYFVTERLGTEKGWKGRGQWNRIYDRRKLDTQKPIQRFLKRVEAILQKDEEEEFADGEEDTDGEEDRDGKSDGEGPCTTDNEEASTDAED